MNLKGSYIMERGWWLHPALAGDAKRCMAWEYMMSKAAFAPHLARLKSTGKMYTVNRGQFVTSFNDLTAELSMWGFTKESTRLLLKKLEDHGLIERDTNTRRTVVTICNYDDFQNISTYNNTRTTHQRQNFNTVNNTDNNTVDNCETEEGATFTALPVDNNNTPDTHLTTHEKAKSNTHINRTNGKELNIYNTPQTPKGADGELFLKWFELLPSQLQAQKQKCLSYWNKNKLNEEAFKLIPATQKYIQDLNAYKGWKDRNPTLIQEVEKFKRPPFVETFDAYTLLRGKWAAFIPAKLDSAEEFERLRTLEREYAQMTQEIEAAQNIQQAI